MDNRVVVAGGGIAGLACALACARAGVSVQVIEQAPVFGEVGAGLQLGPNAVKVLNDWGLWDDLHARAVFPECLVVRDAHSAQDLGRLRLGAMSRARYGTPYATLHRADLHAMLLSAVKRQPGVRMALRAGVQAYEESGARVVVTTDTGTRFEGAALIGCDGLWSAVRAQMLGPQPVRASGHLAYRGLVQAKDLSESMRQSRITAWLGPRLHVVQYPVRQDEWVNVVAVVSGVLGEGHGERSDGDARNWTHEAQVGDLLAALGPACPELLTLIEAVPLWKLWALHDRAPMAGPHEHAQGRVALMGDAAHPMRPYLAQGAAMALEDAWTLGRLLEDARSRQGDIDWPALLRVLAQSRWRRNAKVQQRAERNGRIFHAGGLLRWARNLAMATMGEDLLDNAWLYQGPPGPDTVST